MKTPKKVLFHEFYVYNADEMDKYLKYMKKIKILWMLVLTIAICVSTYHQYKFETKVSRYMKADVGFSAESLKLYEYLMYKTRNLR